MRTEMGVPPFDQCNTVFRGHAKLDELRIPWVGHTWR
jgi:hypothetical protein